MSQEIVKTAERTQGGPKTESGKAKSALNALKHGARSAVILPWEQEDYDAHRQALMESLSPAGYLEERLAERVALTLWRLGRIEAWEATVLSEQAREAKEHALSSNSLDLLLSSLERGTSLQYQPVESLSMREVLKELERLTGGSGHAIVATWPEEAAAAQEELELGERLEAFLHREDIKGEEILALGVEGCSVVGNGIKQALEAWGVPARKACKAILGKASKGDVEGWDCGDWEWQEDEIAPAWALLLSEYEKRKDASNRPGLILYRAGGELKNRAERLLALGERLRLLLEERQEKAVMPSVKEADRLQRYEAHLERVLYRALHELEAMQRRRDGQEAPLGRLEVYGQEDAQKP